MPTNVSTPIWRCDICGEKFGEDKTTAQRCESAGPPNIMPAGTLMLGYEATYGSREKSGFLLRQLYPFTRHRMGTLAASHHRRAGHTVTYALDVDPAAHWNQDRGYYDWRNSSQPKQIDSEHLTPNQAGVLQLHTSNWLGHHATVRDDDYDWVFDAVGLPRGTMEPNRDVENRWVRPMTPQIKAVLDALHAFPKFIDDRPDLRRFRDVWLVNNKVGNLALGTVGRVAEGCPANDRRTLWYLRGADQEKLVADLNARWRAWRGGTGKLVTNADRMQVWDECEPSQDDVPVPRMTSTHDYVTASKLSKRLRALVAATGVEWPPRTNATDYANLLVRSLEYRVEHENTLFPGVRVVAVRGRKGGVGKSTIAAALARRLAQAGHRVVLVDFDVAGPSQHIFHNLGPVATDTERVMVLPSETDVPGLRVFSPGQVFGPATKNQWSEAAVGQWVDFIGSSLDLGDAEIVVLDMPPGESGLHSQLGDVFTRPKGRADVHVTTGHPVALADTERDLTHGHPRPGTRFLVENLSRVRGRDSRGDEVELRLHGLTEDAPAMAGRTHTDWGGSMPWANSVTELADSPEMAKLVGQVAAVRR